MDTNQQTEQNTALDEVKKAKEAIPHEYTSDDEFATELTYYTERTELAKYYEAEYRSFLGDIYKKVTNYPEDFLRVFRSALPEIRQAQARLITYYIRQDVINNITDNVLLDIRRNILELAVKLPLNKPPEGLEAHELINYLIALYTRSKDLDNKKEYPIIVELMRLGEVVRERGEVPGIQLWQAINKVVTKSAQPKARPLPTQESLALLETFLTTPKSMRELAKESNGLWSVAGIRKNLHTSLGRIWEDIPQEARQGYETAHEAMQAVIASPIKTEETRRKKRIQPAWKEEKPRQTGKHSQKGITGMRGKVGEHTGGRGKSREFSDTHQTHLSEGAARRWQHERKTRRATQTEDQE